MIPQLDKLKGQSQTDLYYPPDALAQLVLQKACPGIFGKKGKALDKLVFYLIIRSATSAKSSSAVVLTGGAKTILT